jgi:pyrroline-5-carboxylate reductase
MKVGLIGAGNLGKAIIDGLIDEKDVKLRASNLVSEEYKGIVLEQDANKEIVSWADVVILAVKPKFMTEVLSEIKKELQEKIVITVAAVLNISYYKEQGIPHIIRIMPNVAIGKKAGVIGFCASEEIADDDEEQAYSLVQKLGYCIMLEEKHLDTIVALSGSGIAYLTHILGVFIAEGEKEGLSREEATRTLIETVKGAGALLGAGEEAESICSRVATKGGITEQGLLMMQEEGLDEIIQKVAKKTLSACKGK